jgi:hypothetical protein
VASPRDLTQTNSGGRIAFPVDARDVAGDRGGGGRGLRLRLRFGCRFGLGRGRGLFFCALGGEVSYFFLCVSACSSLYSLPSVMIFPSRCSSVASCTRILIVPVVPAVPVVPVCTSLYQLYPLTPLYLLDTWLPLPVAYCTRCTRCTQCTCCTCCIRCTRCTS